MGTQIPNSGFELTPRRSDSFADICHFHLYNVYRLYRFFRFFKGLIIHAGIEIINSRHNLGLTYNWITLIWFIDTSSNGYASKLLAALVVSDFAIGFFDLIYTIIHLGRCKL